MMLQPASSSPAEQAQLSGDFFLMEGPWGVVFCFIHHNLEFMSREKNRKQLNAEKLEMTESLKMLCEKLFVCLTVAVMEQHWKFFHRVES